MLFARDDGTKALPLVVGGVELAERLPLNRPAFKFIQQRRWRKQTVIGRVEHPNVGRALHQNIDCGNTAGAHMSFHIRENLRGPRNQRTSADRWTLWRHSWLLADSCAGRQVQPKRAAR